MAAIAFDRFEALTFDCYGTLIDWEAGILAGLRAILDSAGVTPDDDAADLLYVGEFRSAKGLDTLIDALGLLAKTARRRPSLVLVGDGPERAALSARAESLGVASQLNFRAPMTAREAFAARGYSLESLLTIRRHGRNLRPL